MSDTEWVVFDLGGVLIRLGGAAEFGGMIGEGDEREVWARWLRCPWVRAYERGRCSTADFAAGMVEAYALDMTPDAFLSRFTAWPEGLYPGAKELVAALSREVRTACLSNTNALHWQHQVDAEVLHGLFPKRFLSYELDLIKPDDAIYEHVVSELGCPAASVLFLDDNQINVDAARRSGIDAHRVAGIDEVRALLGRRGLL